MNNLNRNSSNPWEHRVVEMRIGSLVRVLLALDQPLQVRQLVGQTGVVVDKPQCQFGTMFDVLVDEKVIRCHILDLELCLRDAEKDV